MSVEYDHAPQVQRIAEDLVPKHHGHLIGTRIEYVFRDSPERVAGKAVWGKARKISGLNAYLSRDDGSDFDGDDYFVVEIARDVWDDLSDNQRDALVDHELAHCRVGITEDGETRLTIAPHDLEEFVAVVERNGLWRGEVTVFARAAAEQLMLPVTSEQIHDIATETARRVNEEGVLGPNVTASAG